MGLCLKESACPIDTRLHEPVHNLTGSIRPASMIDLFVLRGHSCAARLWSKVPATHLEVAVCVGSHEPVTPIVFTPFEQQELDAFS